MFDCELSSKGELIMDRRTVLVGSLGLVLPSVASPVQVNGKSYALLIGVEVYDNPDISQLRYAVKDVTAVGDFLEKSLGYSSVRVMTSATNDVRSKPTHINIIKSLAAIAKDVGPNDTFLLYFSGHGFSKQGQSFLGSINVDPDSIETLRLSSVPVIDLQTMLRNIKARQVILIMDACRNDPEAGKGDGDNKLTGDLAKSLGVAAKSASESGGGSAMLFACSEGERAFEEPGFEKSVFTHYLLEGLSGKAGSLGIEDIVSYTAGAVTKWAKERGKKQTPDHVRFGTGKLAFGVSRSTVPKPVDSVVVVPTGVVLEFLDVPVGANIKVDDLVVSGTVFSTELADKTKEVEVSISANGFRPYVRRLTLTRGLASTHRVMMEPKATESKPVPMPNPINSNRLTDYPALKAYVESLCRIPAGTFQMGSSSGQSDGQPVHPVTLSAFRMGATPVTFALWKEYCAATGVKLPEAPSWGMLDDHPVVNVSWNDIMGSDGKGGFCAWASDIVGFRLTLPTEAQFEYAARGGQSGRVYPWGDNDDDSKIWSSVSIKRSSTAAVKSSKNRRTGSSFEPFRGLSDMSGNVWQWCSDLYAPYSSVSQTDPVGPPSTSDNRRCVRGGSWYNDIRVFFRCAYRNWYNPDYWNFNFGFRLSAGPS
jgi:formylglycine-generating enzyme required for sulfatase activity